MLIDKPWYETLFKLQPLLERFITAAIQTSTDETKLLKVKIRPKNSKKRKIFY